MSKILLLLLLVSGPAFAFDAECMVPGGKFTPCVVDVLADSLSVRYQKDAYAKQDQVITADRIQRVTQGKSEQHDAQKSLVFGPLLFLRLFDRDPKAKEMFGIDYLNEKGKLKYLLIRIPPDQVFTFGTSLKKLHP